MHSFPRHPHPPLIHRVKMHDKRVLTCISAMMGLDVIGPDGETTMDDDTPAAASSSKTATPPPSAAPKEEKMDVDKTPEQISVGKTLDLG